MDRGSPSRLARDLALLLAALGVAELSRSNASASAVLLVAAGGVFAWSRHLSAVKSHSARGNIGDHPWLLTFVYLLTIGPAVFYLTYADVFGRSILVTLAVAVGVSLLVSVLRWALVGRDRS